MIFFKTLRQKILFVFAFCATITLIGFFTVYFITLEQHQSLEKQIEIPSFSVNWFKLNNGIMRSTRAVQSFQNSKEKKFINEHKYAWNDEIEPTFDHLGRLYKKTRVWTGKRAVERRAFYDLRLMILELKNIQQKSITLAQTNINNESLFNFSKDEGHLVKKILKQVELLVRWQNDFAIQRLSELQKASSRLGIWIWLIASIVLILVLIIALFFAKRISAPLIELRREVNKVIMNQKNKSTNTKFWDQETKKDFSESEDEVKKLTDSFKEMEFVIKERTTQLEQSNIKLDKSNRAKGMYLTNMSHELRTPLNAIIGFAEVLLKTEKNEPLSSYKKDRLNRILKSGKHLLELINSLLDISKIEAGQMEIEKKEFQLRILLQDLMEWLEPLIVEKSLKYEIVFQTEDKINLYSDPGKVRQILINLIGNAIKFTKSGGHIKIIISKNENSIHISIKDTGCGISEEEHDSIFKIFHQVKSANNLEFKKGTGLGLSLVKSLMKLLGGTITLESKIGQGSKFTIIFPSNQNPSNN